jgi:prevent-host-death family protein
MTTKSVTASDAGERFLELLDDVRRGETVVVMSDGKPVATLAPVSEKSQAEGNAARQRLFERLDKQPALNLPRWTRDELYDD